MSNARNLSDLLGTGTTIATASIADDAITAAKIATDAVVADGLSSSAIARGDLPADSIIQVKQTVASGNLGSGTQDLVSVSITPTDNTNKILVLGHTNCYSPAGATSYVDMYRGTTFLYRSAIGVGYGAAARSDAASPMYLDDPQTTSSITYKLQGISTGATPGSWNYYTSSFTAYTSITVMEIVV